MQVSQIDFKIQKRFLVKLQLEFIRGMLNEFDIKLSWRKDGRTTT